ncbi:ABC transporter substrate-binding protein [Rhodovulum sulfidophilum]|uniref:ABC transporter substrate-binding protein n=1 Tax=Rhodovulum sulfidophilum TaxID=35806 RepID=UPI0019243324|nr:ABC transporter substrate-binding protein [Rhodovulum sulfidophilum]MBL3575548.1 ABC transporter substrate-binding protein [Rhodovulum sulfidophilum]MCE8432745.1 ABC transporter substrate-binding protein [Rhodovulum sulfidophilum]MCF4118619.1 ABC transporter substrate-binding protein [Rhodovulum sulfidophilum]
MRLHSCLKLTSFIVGAAAWGGVATAQDLEQVTVVVPNPSAILYMPIAVAMGEGYFEAEGLDVEVEAVNGSGAVLQALVSGQGDIGNPGAGPFLQARNRDVPVKFIYRLNPNSSYGIVVPEDSDYQSPEDLRGLTIGVGTADGAEAAFARTIFSEAGMQGGEDYEILVVGDGGQATAGFLREDIDAYVAATNDAAILNGRGMPVRNITPAEFRVYFGNGLAAMESWLEENEETVLAFGRALVRGAEFAAQPDNIEAVIDHAAAQNPQEGEDRDFARNLVEQIIIRQTPFEPERGWGYQDLDAWQAWQDSLVSSGELDEPIEDLEAVYTNEYIDPWNEAVQK